MTKQGKLILKKYILENSIPRSAMSLQFQIDTDLLPLPFSQPHNCQAAILTSLH